METENNNSQELQSTPDTGMDLTGIVAHNKLINRANDEFEALKHTLTPAPTEGEAVAPTNPEVVAAPQTEGKPSQFDSFLPASDDDEDESAPVIASAEVEKKPLAPGELNEEQLANVDKVMENMDKELLEASQTFTNIIPEDKREDQSEADDDKEEEVDPEEQDREAYGRAVIIIDKGNMGVVNFSEEERKKLELARTIRLEEVETVELSQIKIAKKKTQNVDTIIRQKQSFFSTPIVLPASGYTANILGLSSHELLTLVNSTQNPVLDMQTRWSLIHSKLESSSIGDMDYDTFMKSTSVSDFNVLVFGLLCATYPEDDNVTMSCENPECKHNNPENPYLHSYSTRSLLRVEKMSEVLQLQVRKIIDNATMELAARQVHADAPINQSVRYVLPHSRIIIEHSDQTAYDFVNKSLPTMASNLEEKYQPAAILSTMIRAMYVPREDGQYDRFAEATEITKLIFSLQDLDTRVIQSLASKQGTLAFEFGFMNVKCPACGTYHGVVPVENLEDMVFYRYQQNMTANVE